MTDFHVVPAALRLQAEEIRQASGHWGSAADWIEKNNLTEDSLGYFGKSIVQTFNQVAADVSDKLRQGKRAIESASDGIDLCANHFESLDAEYYRRFGYIDEKLGY
ncbi:hypothetical protein [Nocardia sp. CNY236]|uniref:hypothetical protein n=1 Tax=Nocardia sp. CNY236 TaxID=1169152 RepID=UPI00049099BE|nr:hypothetical protein [Nocardia sp. CNY236]